MIYGISQNINKHNFTEFVSEGEFLLFLSYGILGRQDICEIGFRFSSIECV